MLDCMERGLLYMLDCVERDDKEILAYIDY